MFLESYFDPSTATSGTMDVNAADVGTRVKLQNQSPYNLRIIFPNDFTDILGAWEVNVWTLDGYTPQLKWEQLPSLNVATPPISQCFVVTYAPGERVEGTYPTSMSHQTTIGNNGGVNTNVTTTDNINNSGNPFQTPMITGKPIDATAPFVTLYNSGGGEFEMISNGAILPYMTMTEGAYNTPASFALAVVTTIGLQPGAKLYFTDSSGNHIASLDSSGNMKLKGTLTQNTTP